MANAEGLLAHIAARWDIEVFFGDSKEELGLDHYQMMSASALLRFWTLAMLAYVFLEQEQQRLRVLWQRPVTIGEARREIQRRHCRCLSGSMISSFPAFILKRCLSCLQPEAAQLKSAKIEKLVRQQK